MTGGELVARALAAAGVDTLFTLVGGHTTPVVDACYEVGIRLVDVRHEETAAHMAHARARVTGGTGVVLVTAGPGVTNTATAIANAWSGGAPVLLALNATGALLGALVYGAARWSMEPRRRILLLSGGLFVSYSLLAIVPGLPLMIVLVVLTGVFLAPMLTVAFGLIGQLAPRGTTTEAFAWLITLFTAGASIGAAAVGPILDGGNLHLAAANAGLGAAGCLLLVAAGHRLLRSPAAIA